MQVGTARLTYKQLFCSETSAWPGVCPFKGVLCPLCPLAAPLSPAHRLKGLGPLDLAGGEVGGAAATSPHCWRQGLGNLEDQEICHSHRGNGFPTCCGPCRVLVGCGMARWTLGLAQQGSSDGLMDRTLGPAFALSVSGPHSSEPLFWEVNRPPSCSHHD